MEFKFEDYKICMTQYSEFYVEVDISRNDEFVTGTFTTNIFELSKTIKEIIISNELKVFGYIRFDIDNSNNDSNIFDFTITKDSFKKVSEMKGISKDYLEQCKQTSKKYKK